jgi:hypothetical protein
MDQGPTSRPRVEPASTLKLAVESCLRKYEVLEEKGNILEGERKSLEERKPALRIL